MKHTNFIKICALFLLLYPFISNVSAQDLKPAQWPHLKGYWKFQNINNLTKSTVGKDLVLIGKHQYTTGPAVGDTAIRIAIGSYYDCRHGMAPNGGGDSVNQYTLMFDFKVLNFKKWHTFFKTDSNNNNDGECFIRPITGSKPGCIGVAATGYSNDSINPNQWYRLVISVNLNNFYRYYINGKLFHEGDTQEVDGRFALTPKMIFFGDDNQEDDTIDVASVAVFDTCLSAKDIATIGSIDPCVANPPKISLGRDTTLCDYSSIVKSAGAGFKKYQWSTGGSLSAITITKNIGIGKKNIWCKVTDVNGCIAIDTFVLTYLASPVVNLGANQAFCQGLNTKLTAGTDTSYQYLWKYLPKGNVLSVKNNITVDSGGNYMSTVTNKAGCFNTDTIQITVYKRPAKPTISITGKTRLCKGETVILDGPNGYFDYHWSNGLNQQTIGVNKNDTLKLKVTDNNGCTSFYSDSIVVKVFALPPKPKLTLSGNSTFCDGDSLTLIAPAGYKSYIWPDMVRADRFRYIHVAGLFYVLVKDSNDCLSQPSDSVLTKVNLLPTKPIIQLKGKAEFCLGEWTQISAPSGFKGYTWMPDSRHAQIDTIFNSGSYSVKVENANGCISVASDAIDIVVHPLPSKPTVEKLGNDSLRSGTVGNHYKWFLNGFLISDTGRALQAINNNYYQVQTENEWCWSLRSDSFLYTNSSLYKLSDHVSGLLVYPNPASTEVIIQLMQAKQLENATIVLSDIQGKEVYRAEVSGSDLNTGFTVNLQQLAIGIYQLSIFTTDGILRGKIEKR